MHSLQPSRGEVTFHLPLLRYFSAFVKQVCVYKQVLCLQATFNFVFLPIQLFFQVS